MALSACRIIQTWILWRKTSATICSGHWTEVHTHVSKLGERDGGVNINRTFAKFALSLKKGRHPLLDINDRHEYSPGALPRRHHVRPHPLRHRYISYLPLARILGMLLLLCPLMSGLKGNLSALDWRISLRLSQDSWRAKWQRPLMPILIQRFNSAYLKTRICKPLCELFRAGSCGKRQSSPPGLAGMI
jgi:hypothetical protein